MKTGVRITVLLSAMPIAAFVYLMTNASSAQEGSPDMLPLVLQGCKEAVRSIGSGKGRVTVQRRIAKREGGSLDTETVYEVAFCGGRFKTNRQIRYIANEPGGEMERNLSLIAPGTVLTEQAAFDGERVRRLDAERKRGVVADFRSSGAQDELLSYKLDLAVGSSSTLGSGLCDLQAFYESLLFPGTTGTGLAVVGRESIQGDDCMVLECTYDFLKPSGEHFDDIRRFWVNISKGYTIARVRIWSEGGNYPERTLVCEWDAKPRQYSDGIWGPGEIVETQYGIDPTTRERIQKDHTVIKFDPDFALNVSVTEQDLLLTFPSGTTVTDQDIDATYTVP